jgi:hypothetical protein
VLCDELIAEEDVTYFKARNCDWIVHEDCRHRRIVEPAEARR